MTRQGTPRAPPPPGTHALVWSSPTVSGQVPVTCFYSLAKLWNVTSKVNLQKQWLPVVGKAHMTRPPTRKKLTPSVQQPTSNWIQPVTLWKSLEADLPGGDLGPDGPCRAPHTNAYCFKPLQFLCNFIVCPLRITTPHGTDTLLPVPKTLNYFPHYISFRYTHDSVFVYTVKVTTKNLVNNHHHTVKNIFHVTRTLKSILLAQMYNLKLLHPMALSTWQTLRAHILYLAPHLLKSNLQCQRSIPNIPANLKPH